KDIFFFKKWQEGYRKFIRKIKSYYNNGNTWVAHFDLAAYYDTISHNVLADQISKRAYPNFKDLLKECLKTWTTNKSQKIGHGIPQGPIASNLIGEIYLLPIDIAVKTQEIKCVRYVDDIKIFGKSRNECLESAIFLEKECKERGLIPQSKKYKVLKAEKIEDAIGKFPSLSVNDKSIISSKPSEATKIFKNSFNENKFDISKVRYILKVSSNNDEILDIIIKNLNQHPDLTPEFCQFLSNYSSDSVIGEKIFNTTLKYPSEYEFVEGKYWELLSNFNIYQNMRGKYITAAIERLKQACKKPEKPALRLGIYKFLASSGNCLVIPWLKNEKYAFIQMLVVPYIAHGCYDKPEFLDLVNWFLKRTSFEPALVSIKQLLFNFNLNVIQRLDKPKKDPSGVLNNILGNKEKIDTIGQILKNRYKIPYFNKWRKFLGKNYNHANEILYYADKSYYIDKNAWVNYNDSFNDIVIRKFVSLLQTKRPKIKWPKTVNKKNENIDFGVIMDEKNKLSTQYPKIVDKFRIFHERRRETPASHAFDKKSRKPASIVTSGEQKKLSNCLKNGYDSLISELKKLL
ncbi:MAG: hypothetical protein GWP10_22530, partial [Nitrospiraceae bacterium]|nr:hypothetical protein [Nitrospiraceae bacterium]